MNFLSPRGITLYIEKLDSVVYNKIMFEYMTTFIE